MMMMMLMKQNSVVVLLWNVESTSNLLMMIHKNADVEKELVLFWMQKQMIKKK